MQSESPIQQVQETQSQKSVPAKTVYGYAIGAMTDVIFANVVFALAMPIYNIGLGLSSIWIGYAIAIPRLWEAFTDPLIGNLSDNTRSKWGRRRPYILFGALLTSCLCAFLWMPPRGHSQQFQFVYFLVMSILFYTSFAVFTIPYHAFGMELTADYNERTKVMAYKAFFMNLGGMVFLPWAYKLCFVLKFGGDEIDGAKYVGAMYGILGALFAVSTFLLCREKVETQKQEKIGFVTAIRFTFANRPFLILCVAVFWVIIGFYMVFPLLIYINIAYVFQGVVNAKESAATLGAFYNTMFGLVAVLIVPLISWAAVRWGKCQILIAGLSIMIAGFALSWFLFTPKHPYLQLVTAALLSPGMSCVWLLASSMIADICDVDQLNTGLRREGMYGAAFSWVVKIAVAGVIALTGYILVWANFDAEKLTQTADAIFRLRLVFTVVPIIFLVIAVVTLVFYPLNKQAVEQVQRQLAGKKQVPIV